MKSPGESEELPIRGARGAGTRLSVARHTPMPLRGVAIFAASVGAVALWSLKPVLVATIGDRAGAIEVFLASALIAAGVSVGVVLLRWGDTVALVRSGGQWRVGAAWACLSGLFLGVWYFGFYQALYTAPKVDATIIAFTWPMIAVLAMRWFSPQTAPPLGRRSWALVGLAFVGVVIVSASGTLPGRGGVSSGLGWAVVAAIGSGCYLPFAIRATSRFESALKSSPRATFYAIAIANLSALGSVLIAALATQKDVDFSRFNAATVAICAVIGIGTYITAEVAWTWAFAQHKSLTLSSLPYLSPAVSTVLLAAIFAEPVTVLAVIGLVLIVGANLALHVRRRRSPKRSVEGNEVKAA